MLPNATPPPAPPAGQRRCLELGLPLGSPQQRDFGGGDAAPSCYDTVQPPGMRLRLAALAAPLPPPGDFGVSPTRPPLAGNYLL